MKNNNNTPQPDTRWLIHKWVLILWAMYYCYKILHISRGLEVREVVWCGIITLIFASVIKYHQEIRSLKRNPHQFVALSPLAAVGNIMRFVVYFILILHIFLLFVFMCFMLSSVW